MNDIGKDYRDLLEQRRVKMREALKDYDQNIYYPTLKEIRARCNTMGHVKSSAPRHYNGLGSSWDHCGLCGSQMNIETP